MKLQKLRGQHSSFWLQPEAGSAAVPAKLGGAEIDVVEWIGHPSGAGLASHVYYTDDSGQQVKAGGWIKHQDRYGDDWWGSYHVFSVEWTPEAYTFRIDGQVTDVINDGVSGVAQFLILSNMASDYEMHNLPSEDDLPQTAYVDWVRVWKR
jgi:beta-glucanase (GH16 family)